MQDRETIEARPRIARRELLALAAILAIGLAVRLAFLARFAALPLFHELFGDEQNFHETALGLLGLGPSPDSFLYQPLYSFFLALVYSLFGVDPAIVRIVQLGLGLANTVLLWALARELFGPGPGLLAALFGAVYGPFVFFEAELLAPAVKVPACTAACWLAVRSGLKCKIGPLLAAGVCAGLVLMARPNFAIVLPVFAIWLWSAFRARGAPPLRRIVAFGLAGVGLCLGLLPSWIHNARAGLPATPVSSSLGHSFFLGNNPDATGAYHVPRGSRIDADSHAAYRASLGTLAENALGRTLSPAEVSSYWFGRGLAFWRDQPLDALGLFGKKLLLAFSAQEVPIHYSYAAVQELVPLLGWLPGFGALLPFAAVGLWLLRRRPGVLLLAGSAILYLLGVSAFYAADRYRVLSVPMLMPLAAGGAFALFEVGRRARWREQWGVLLLAAAALTTALLPIEVENQRASLYRLWNLMGKASAERGNRTQARADFEAALAIAGYGHGALARLNLGLLCEQEGDMSCALEHYRTAARLDPENRYVRHRLAELAERAGRLDEALGWWQELARLEADPGPAERAIERLRARLGER